jgi:hypothetical protein
MNIYLMRILNASGNSKEADHKNKKDFQVGHGQASK